MAALRADDRFAIGDDGVRELREEQRPVGDVAASALADVGAVVQPDADDLAGPVDRRGGLQVAERPPRSLLERWTPSQPGRAGSRRLRQDVEPRRRVRGRVADEDQPLPCRRYGVQAHRAPRSAASGAAGLALGWIEAARSGDPRARRPAGAAEARSARPTGWRPGSARAPGTAAPAGRRTRRRRRVARTPWRRTRARGSGPTPAAAARAPRPAPHRPRPSSRTVRSPGEIRPAGTSQIGLGGNVSKNCLNCSWPASVAPSLSPRYRITMAPCSRLWIQFGGPMLSSGP